jgi:hypothetical protein
VVWCDGNGGGNDEHELSPALNGLADAHQGSTIETCTALKFDFLIHIHSLINCIYYHIQTILPGNYYIYPNSIFTVDYCTVKHISLHSLLSGDSSY